MLALLLLVNARGNQVIEDYDSIWENKELLFTHPDYPVLTESYLLAVKEYSLSVERLKNKIQYISKRPKLREKLKRKLLKSKYAESLCSSILIRKDIYMDIKMQCEFKSCSESFYTYPKTQKTLIRVLEYTLGSKMEYPIKDCQHYKYF